MIFVNFKTYQEGTGEAALNLAKICRQVEKEMKIKIIPVVQTADIFHLTSQGFEVWAQHVDDINFGPNTGQILPQSIIAAEAKGTLLNHSENKLPTEVVDSIIKRIRELEISEFRVLVCCESVEEGLKISQFKPDLIAYEPPELIGGDVSVSTAKPEIIREFVKEIREIPILVGAGIQTTKDVKVAIKLGAVGILVSSGIVLAENPKEKLQELAEGFISRA
jgi:triosephosphate isomerase